jgi:hypothetical protein
MKKLNKMELDVVINEVINSLKVIEDNKGKELFEKSKNKDLYLKKINEYRELEEKLDKLRKEIYGIEALFKEDGINVSFNSWNERSWSGNDDLFFVNLKNSKVGSYNLNKKIENEIVLSNLEGLNIRDMIKDLVEKYK